MWLTNKGVQLTGRLGEMLERPLSDVKGDGEVSGVFVSYLRPIEGRQAVCQWCANDSELVVSLELTQRTVFAGFTRQVVMTLCLGVCSSCYSNLTQSLKEAKNKQSAR